jgi:hypothetical protein
MSEARDGAVVRGQRVLGHRDGGVQKNREKLGDEGGGGNRAEEFQGEMAFGSALFCLDVK